ncbi:helix-turn-helix domain-containing protein [Agaribacillus aureus]|uniref:helix-turn-helix domain-containing protein n=1 Tax=Agaribacillus aureus TaxID=3051825 RepID=UPI003211968C
MVADKLGLSQQAISKIEQSDKVDDNTLEKVSKALGVNVEAIKNFSEQAIFNNINTFHDSSSLNDHSALFNYQCTFNPIDKLVGSLEENKRLQEANKKLYEELLKSEREKVVMLQKLLEEKK